MKISTMIFSILTSIFMLLAVTIFAAETLIFIITQFYYYIFEVSGFWAAFLIVLLMILLLSCLFLELTKKTFVKTFKSNKEHKRYFLLKKLFTSIFVYELIKFFHRSRRNKQ
jgi:hypothetical protein